jgi:hypothetical protein
MTQGDGIVAVTDGQSRPLGQLWKYCPSGSSSCSVITKSKSRRFATSSGCPERRPATSIVSVSGTLTNVTWRLTDERHMAAH